MESFCAGVAQVHCFEKHSHFTIIVIIIRIVAPSNSTSASLRQHHIPQSNLCDSRTALPLASPSRQELERAMRRATGSEALISVRGLWGAQGFGVRGFLLEASNPNHVRASCLLGLSCFGRPNPPSIESVLGQRYEPTRALKPMVSSWSLEFACCVGCR